MSQNRAACNPRKSPGTSLSLVRGVGLPHILFRCLLLVDSHKRRDPPEQSPVSQDAPRRAFTRYEQRVTNRRLTVPPSTAQSSPQMIFSGKPMTRRRVRLAVLLAAAVASAPAHRLPIQ